jgi:lysophospholipase L1-like esterase
MLKAFLVFVGTGCVAAALAVNPWTVSPLLGVSGLPAVFRGVIGVADLVVAGLGVLLIRQRHSRSLAAGVVLASLTTVICLFVVEAFLRLAEIQPGVLSLFLPPPDSAHIYRLKPDLDLETRIEGSAISIRTNSHGMRWRDAPTEKPAGSTRIAFVGDSFTFGQWASSAERSLVGVFDAEMQPLGFDVLNFGVPGYGFLEIEEQLETDVKAFHPDYVALVSFNGNDFMDTYVGFGRYEIRPNGTLRTDGDEIAARIPAPFYRQGGSRHIALLERIYLFNIVQAVLKGVVAAPPPDAGFPPRRPPFESATNVSNIFWSRREYPPFAEAARAVSIEALGRIAAFAEANGARLIIITLPTPQQVYFEDSFPETYDPTLPQRYVEEFARSRQIPYLDLLPPMAEHYRRTGANLHFQQEGHFNDEGHRVAGELVAAFFKGVIGGDGGS